MLVRMQESMTVHLYYFLSTGLQIAQTALEYVERVRNSPCTGGTDEVLPVQFDHSMWYQYADVAVRMANLLTKVLIHNNNKFLASQEEFLYDLVRNNVDSDSLIFGSAIAVSDFHCKNKVWREGILNFLGSQGFSGGICKGLVKTPLNPCELEE